MLKTLTLSILAYALVALIAFNDLAKPIYILPLFSDRLGIPYWPWFIIVSYAVASLVFFLPSRLYINPYKAPIFIMVSMSISIISVGIYANNARTAALSAFSPDAQIDNSFFMSLRAAPNEHQFFLHAAALKNCEPYGWSYRHMNFYRIPPNVAVNVLPRDWLVRCSIAAG